MNRMFLALIAFCVPCAAHAADQKNGPKPFPNGTTRVAIVNLGVILTKYDKATDFKAEMARNMKDLQEEAKKLQIDLVSWQNALQKNDLKNGTKEEYEEKLINGRRRLEDLGRTASSTVGKTQQVHLETLWTDMQDAVKAYATEHKIDMVLAIGDPVQKDLVAAFPNIERKLRAADQGSAVPFFVGPGVDISEAIVDRLNKKYRDTKSIR